MKEGLCVQMMHMRPFDDEPTTVAIMDEFLRGNGYDNDFTDERLHHEIYLSDANYNSCRAFRSNRRRKIDLVT